MAFFGTILLFHLQACQKLSSHQSTSSKIRNDRVHEGRVVSTNLSSDELLIELLDRANALHRLQALSSLAWDSRYSHIHDKIPGHVVPSDQSIEALLATQPNLVVMAAFNRHEWRRQLINLGLNVVVLDDFSSLLAIEEHIQTLGRTLGLLEAAGQLLQDMKQQRRLLNQGRKRHRSQRCLVLHWNGGTMASGTILDEIMKLSGCLNLASDAGLNGWPKLATEAIWQWQPDWLIVSDDGGGAEVTKRRWQNHPHFSKLQAVQKGKLVVLSRAEFSSASHYSLRAAKKIQQQLHKQGPRT